MATSKVYYCHICEDDGIYINPYNRKQYFAHIKTDFHQEKARMAHFKVPMKVREGVLNKTASRKMCKTTLRQKNQYVDTIGFFFSDEIEKL